MSKFWFIVLSFIVFVSCHLNENPISEELNILKKDILSINQIDSILKKNEIPESKWSIHKTDSIDGIYIPFNLYDCFIQIDSLFSDSLIAEMNHISNDEIIGNYHFGIGLWIRNNWGLWKNSRLWMYFYNKGISHPDDISSLILKLYHRKITSNKLLFQKEIESIKESIAEDNKIERKEKNREIAISSLVDEGDSIKFQIPINLESNSLFFYAYPALIFEDQNETRDSMLIISGIVIDKSDSEIDSVSNYRIKILRLSQQGVKVFSGKEIGDEIELGARELYLID